MNILNLPCQIESGSLVNFAIPRAEHNFASLPSSLSLPLSLLFHSFKHARGGLNGARWRENVFIPASNTSERRTGEVGASERSARSRQCGTSEHVERIKLESSIAPSLASSYPYRPSGAARRTSDSNWRNSNACIQRLRIIWGQCCPRIAGMRAAAGPYRPNGAITHLSYNSKHPVQGFWVI